MIVKGELATSVKKFTKKKNWKFMKNTLYVLWYAKRHHSSKTIKVYTCKPVALVIIKLHLSEGISQLKVLVKSSLCSIFLKVVQVDLKV